MSEASVRENRSIVEQYFERMASGDPRLAELLDEDVCWVAPQSSPVGHRHEGKAAVLALIGKGVGLYDTSRPMETRIEAIAAEGDRVFAEMTLRATTAHGESYHNHYVFVFRLREGRIVKIHEYLDSLYAQRLLFDPAERS